MGRENSRLLVTSIDRNTTLSLDSAQYPVSVLVTCFIGAAQGGTRLEIWDLSPEVTGRKDISPGNQMFCSSFFCWGLMVQENQLSFVRCSLSMDKALMMTKGQTWSLLSTKTSSMPWILSSHRWLPLM